jgi:hypothetical protein
MTLNDCTTSDRRRAQTSGLVFSTIHLGERANAVADIRPMPGTPLAETAKRY